MKQLAKKMLRTIGLEVRRAGPPARTLDLQHVIGTIGVDHVLDVGANTGQFGRYMRSIGFAGRIDSYVPALGDVLPGESERFFLKLDTQGHDLSVLQGLPDLDRVRMVQVELALALIYDEMPPSEEVIGYLRQRGFRLSSMWPLTRMPYDATMIEADGLFVRAATG